MRYSILFSIRAYSGRPKQFTGKVFYVTGIRLTGKRPEGQTTDGQTSFIWRANDRRANVLRGKRLFRDGQTSRGAIIYKPSRTLSDVIGPRAFWPITSLSEYFPAQFGFDPRSAAQYLDAQFSRRELDRLCRPLSMPVGILSARLWALRLWATGHRADRAEVVIE